MTDLSQMTDDDLLATYQQLKAAKPGKVYAMPGGVTNKINEDLEIIGTGTATNARMEPYKADLRSQEINLGPVRNLFMSGQNWAGRSSPESRKYATFQSDLEKMRNDSLRLNKGQQTEGDATRAWKELFKNMNDEKLVADRLAQIQSYNDEAVRQRKFIVNGTRRQYGQPEPDYSKLETPRNAFMGAGQQAAPPPSRVAPSSLSPQEQAELAALRAKHRR